MSFRPFATIVPLLVAVMASASSRDSTVNLRPWTRPRTWDIEIASPDEPGPRFVMSGRVLGPDSMPMPGVEMYFYHADSKGYYARQGQRFNRIAGVLRTNKRGEYRVCSVVPGMYAGPGHVHFEI